LGIEITTTDVMKDMWGSMDSAVTKKVAIYIDSLPTALKGYAIELWDHFFGKGWPDVEPDPTYIGLTPLEVGTVRMELLPLARTSSYFRDDLPRPTTETLTSDGSKLPKHAP
jgi:hypothetical protein